MNKQKGFIQIPLLIAIIVVSIGVVSAGTSIILYKEGKLAPLVANISEVFENNKEFATEEKENNTGKSQVEQNQRPEKAGLETEKDKEAGVVQENKIEKPKTEIGKNIAQSQSSEINDNSINNLQSQIDALLKQITALQQQSQTQQQNQANTNESNPVPNQITTPESILPQKEPEYELKILTFTPIYADVDYENPPNKEINHYKAEVQFGDKNNIIDSIDGNLKIFFENKFFQGKIYIKGIESPASNVLVYDNFIQSESELPNPFLFEYNLSGVQFPDNEEQYKNYFIAATYKDKLYRLNISSYFNFEHIFECDQLVLNFENDPNVKRAPSIDQPNPIEKYLALAKNYQCYKSLRYKEMQGCLRSFSANPRSSPYCGTLIKNVEQ